MRFQNVTRKLIEMINNFIKVAGFKVNYKNQYLYTNNKQKEIMGTFPYTIASKNLELKPRGKRLLQ